MATSFHSNQSISPVIFRLDKLLPSLACGPYSDTTLHCQLDRGALAQLASLCRDMKGVGSLLDNEQKEKMDITQTLLTKIVQDTQLDLPLRLRLLEFIELRTLDWKRSEAVDNYYQERFAHFEENKRKDQEKKDAKKKRKLSFPSLSSIQEPSDDHQFLTVNGEKIFLDSSNPELTANAKKLLIDHFSSKLSVPSNIKYSRTDLLTLATSPLAREAPHDWDQLVENIPAVVQRPPVSIIMAASGDSNPSPTHSMQNISAMPASLPFVRNVGR